MNGTLRPLTDHRRGSWRVTRHNATGVNTIAYGARIILTVSDHELAELRRLLASEGVVRG